MTENEKVIISLLAQYRALSKRDLEAKGKMSWATVVKMVNRLEESKIIQRSGIQERNDVKGKNAILYELSGKTMAVGIDIEYSKTTLLLTNLRDEKLKEATYPTPEFTEENDVVNFVEECLTDFLKPLKIENIYGLGVGIPLFICPSEGNIFLILQEKLEQRLNTRVKVDNSMRAYLLDRKIRTGNRENSIHIIIRGGIGVGIYFDKKLYKGDNLLSGEISHLKIQEDGIKCHCGQVGCLETIVNENILFEKYQTLNIDNKKSEKNDGLTDLFRRCKHGEPEALYVVRESMINLSKGLVPLLLIMDISNITISGHFGADGSSLIPLLKGEIEKSLYFQRSLNLQYEPIMDQSFLSGAAQFFTSDFTIF